MKANEINFLKFLKDGGQFTIPIYQRVYSWGDRECTQLWSDILKAGTEQYIPSHFVGSIVYINSSNLVGPQRLMVIDGQQRLTSLSLLLAALSTHILEDQEPVDGFSKRKIRNYYLTNPEESKDRFYKLLLTQTDKLTLHAIIDDVPLPVDTSLQIKSNFELFQRLIKENASKITEICNGLAKLMVVQIALDSSQDNPQLIFESLNSTGLELSQADLIRNYVLMGLESELQERLYNMYWRQMEIEFGQQGYSNYFDAFMRDYLTIKTGEIPKISQVYRQFKGFAEKAYSQGSQVEDIVQEIRENASLYCKMVLGQESDQELKDAFDDIKELRVDVVYPFLLEVYSDYKKGVINKTEFEKVIRLAESYIFRRSICDIPTNSLNKTFPDLLRMIDKSNYLETMQASLMVFPSYRRFPGDEEFGRCLQTKDLYNYRLKNYWLRRMENEGRRERINLSEFSIEHIMPQNITVSWKNEIGEEWERIHSTYLHTLGNLTLTRYNSPMGDRSFRDKLTMENGFAKSPLYLNESVRTYQKWNEDAIRQRAMKLAVKATSIWVMPSAEEATLSIYRARVKAPFANTVANHPYLQKEPTKSLFNALREAILGLDEVVHEEFLALYVAYKAETNFVDVIPLANQLRLAINMRFPEIIDGRGMCRDITNLGRWGNGDVEVKFSNIDDLPYIIGLIRQSLDKQIGDMESGD